MPRLSADRLPAPVPPTGVRVVGPGGGSVPLHLEYAGVNEIGLHLWCGYGPPHQLLPVGFEVHLDTLPPRTSLAVALYQDADGDVLFAPRGSQPEDPVALP